MADAQYLARTGNPRYLRPDAANRRRLIEVLTEAVRLRELLDQEIAYLVAEARSRRVSWRRIGGALGCRHQSAHERYHRASEPPDPQLVRQLDQELRQATKLARKLLSSPAEGFSHDQMKAKHFLDTLNESQRGLRPSAVAMQRSLRRDPRAGA